jgi:serine/threonine protein kinase
MPMHDTVELHVSPGGANGDEIFVLSELETFVAGRSPDAHWTIDEPAVSRHHFLIEYAPPLCRLRNLSKNGTKVNGVRHGAKRGDPSAVDLRHGDLIQVGNARARLVLPRAVPPPTFSLTPARTGPLPATADVSTPPGYDIVHFVGRGRMGGVYLATHVSTGREVALKIQAGAVVDGRATAQFQREGEVLRALRHPHIVDFIEFGSWPGGLFLAMEFVQGRDLARWLDLHRGQVDLAIASPIILQVVRAVSFAHERGIVHRDLKPSNVLIDEAGQIAKVADFGLAKSYASAGISGLTLTDEFGGTPLYMPREQILSYRDCGPSADVFSLGAMTYHLLSGRHSRGFRPDRDPLLVVLEDESAPLASAAPNIPSRLAEVIDRALLPANAGRYTTAADFLHAIEAAL